MPDHGRTPGEQGANSAPQKEASGQNNKPLDAKQAAREAAERARYSQLQSAMRFPLKLPVALKSDQGERTVETQNISANGVLFEMDAAMPVGSIVEFTIAVPADVMGSSKDVQVDCRGRVVRCEYEGGRRGVAVVIDEYHLERR
jgi:PilZ domain-containing protein